MISIKKITYSLMIIAVSIVISGCGGVTNLVSPTTEYVPTVPVETAMVSNQDTMNMLFDKCRECDSMETKSQECITTWIPQCKQESYEVGKYDGVPKYAADLCRACDNGQLTESECKVNYFRCNSKINENKRIANMEKQRVENERLKKLAGFQLETASGVVAIPFDKMDEYVASWNAHRPINRIDYGAFNIANATQSHKKWRTTSIFDSHNTDTMTKDMMDTNIRIMLEQNPHLKTSISYKVSDFSEASSEEDEQDDRSYTTSINPAQFISMYSQNSRFQIVEDKAKFIRDQELIVKFVSRLIAVSGIKTVNGRDSGSWVIATSGDGIIVPHEFVKTQIRTWFKMDHTQGGGVGTANLFKRQSNIKLDRPIHYKPGEGGELIEYNADMIGMDHMYHLVRRGLFSANPGTLESLAIRVLYEANDYNRESNRGIDGSVNSMGATFYKQIKLLNNIKIQTKDGDLVGYGDFIVAMRDILYKQEKPVEWNKYTSSVDWDNIDVLDSYQLERQKERQEEIERSNQRLNDFYSDRANKGLFDKMMNRMGKDAKGGY